MASIDGTISKRTFFYPAREGIGRGFHLAAGEPVRLIANPHTGAPIACLLRNGNEYLAAVLAADVVGGWDPAAAEYGPATCYAITSTGLGALDHYSTRAAAVNALALENHNPDISVQPCTCGRHGG